MTANGGTPVEGAKVQTWIRQNNGGWTAGETGTTDKNGLYSVADAARSRPHGRRLEARISYLPPPTTPTPAAFAASHRSTSSVVFFTDRSLYRPGQTIHFKGIVHARRPGAGQLRDGAESRCHGAASPT